MLGDSVRSALDAKFAGEYPDEEAPAMNKKTLTLGIAYFVVTITVISYYPTLFNHIINWNDGELFNAVSAVMKGQAGLFSQPAYAPLELAFVAFQRSFSEYGYFLFHALSMIHPCRQCSFAFLHHPEVIQLGASCSDRQHTIFGASDPSGNSRVAQRASHCRVDLFPLVDLSELSSIQAGRKIVFLGSLHFVGGYFLLTRNTGAISRADSDRIGFVKG